MIHKNISARGAGFVRAWVFGLWAVYLLGNSNLQNYARVPDLEFAPPGVLKLLPESFYDVLLTTTGLGVLRWVLTAGLVACAFGVRPWRWIAIPTVLLLTLHQGIPRGLFGYVNHKELGALYAAYVLAVFPATSFSPFARRTPRSEDDGTTTRMMMLLMTAVVVIPYCFVGLFRLAHTFTGLWTSDTFAHHIVRTSYGTNWFGNTEISELVLTNSWMLKLVVISFPLGTIVEVLAPLCIVHPKFRRFWVISMVGLHLFTWAVLDILFWENLALYPVLMIDGEFLRKKFDRLRGRPEDSPATEHSSATAEERLVSGSA